MTNTEGTPSRYAEAMKFVVSNGEKKIEVGSILDLEKVIINLEELGASNSLKGLLNRIEGIIFNPLFAEEWDKDPELQKIIVLSLKESLEELSKINLKIKSVSKLGGTFPSVLKIKADSFEKKLNSPEDILDSVQVVMNLIGNYIAEIEPLLSKDQKGELGILPDTEALLIKLKSEVPELDELAQEVSRIVADDDWEALKDKKEKIQDLLGKLKSAINFGEYQELTTILQTQFFDLAKKAILEINDKLSFEPHAQSFNSVELKENLEIIEEFFNLSRLSTADKSNTNVDNVLVVETLKSSESLSAQLKLNPALKEKEKLEAILFYLSKSQTKVQNLISDITYAEIRNKELGDLSEIDGLDDEEKESERIRISIVRDPKSKDYSKAKELLTVLLSEIVKQIDNLKGFASESYLKSIDLVEKKKDPYEMDIEEVINEISEAIVPTDRLKDLNARYFELIGTVKDAQKESLYRTRRGLQAIMVAGDTGVKGFDIGFDSIMVELADKGVDFNNIARALFLKRPNKEMVTAEDMDKAEINMRAIEVYEYVIKRIKHNPDFGGINKDRAKNGNLDYSYNNLLGSDRLRQFNEHLRDKFKDIEPATLEELIKYSQAMAAKSAGYVPWLLRATTRAHGLALRGLRGDAFSDELFVAAPFAADHYSRTRYSDNEPNATSEDLFYVPEHLLEDIVELGPKHHSKFHSLKELWHIINEYRKACWLETPQWVMDVRNMMTVSKNGVDAPETKLDLNKNWFPLPGDVVPNILKMEQRKRNILKMPTRTLAQKNARNKAEAEFLKEAKILGYGKGQKMDDIGLPHLTRLTVDQYMTVSFKAMDKFNKAFREKPVYISKEQAMHKFNSWMKDVVGKAKLVPGSFQLLFGPFTVRMIHTLTRAYEKGHIADQVEELKMEMLKELKGAGGLPDAAAEYVLQHIGKPYVKTLTRYVYDVERALYVGKLSNFKNEFATNPIHKLGRKVPGPWFKPHTVFEAPWEWDKVNENTTDAGHK